MPSGAVHSRIVLSQVAAAGGILLVPDKWWYVGGLLVGILVSPDQDVDDGNVSDLYLRRVARPLSVLWGAFWFAYRRIFKHRGLSHAPVLGTATRVAYVYLWWWGASLLFGFPLVWPPWAFLLGLCVADLGHVLADGAK